jgi:N-acylneuraminate cytidylyltransferase
MRPLVIIPARMGSKGVPQKNFRPLPNGLTLVEMACRMGHDICGQVVVSTDKGKLTDDSAKWSERFGGTPNLVTYLERPRLLCGDDVPMSSVVEHVLRNVKGDPKQPIVLLQPTTPSRDVAMVRKCLKYAKRHDPAATVAEIPAKYARSVPTVPDGRVCVPPRRQECPPRYIFTGDCYAWLRGDGEPMPFLWHPVIVNEGVNIDTPADWLAFCESLRRVRV